MARTGRPQIQIDKTEFEKLCAIWCNEKEIAGWFDISVDTLCRWCKRTYKMTFADIYAQKASKGTVSIRRKQFELAQKGNVALLIWLGKQKLGQTDHYQGPASPDGSAKIDGTTKIIVEFIDESDTPNAEADTTPEKSG